MPCTSRESYQGDLGVCVDVDVGVDDGVDFMVVLMLVSLLMLALSHHMIIDDHEGDVGIGVGVGRFCLLKP